MKRRMSKCAYKYQPYLDVPKIDDDPMAKLQRRIMKRKVEMAKGRIQKRAKSSGGGGGVTAPPPTTRISRMAEVAPDKEPVGHAAAMERRMPPRADMHQMLYETATMLPRKVGVNRMENMTPFGGVGCAAMQKRDSDRKRIADETEETHKRVRQTMASSTSSTASSIPTETRGMIDQLKAKSFVRRAIAEARDEYYNLLIKQAQAKHTETPATVMAMLDQQVVLAKEVLDDAVEDYYKVYGK